MTCVDASRDQLEDHEIAAASFVAFYLPMHTATRLAAPLIARAGAVNPAARLCAYGLYAPLNAEWLREMGVQHVLGPEAEEELLALVNVNAQLPPLDYRSGWPEQRRGPGPNSQGVPRLVFIRPDRNGLPALSRYAALQMPDGSRRVAGSTDATRGCKHVCRHCPIVPVYAGQFRVVPVDVVIEDIRAQVHAGAQHMSFGDPDFLNGPTHARRVLDRVATAFPGLSYDVTIKVEHLLKHRDLLPMLRDTGCLFITTAVESVDDDVLARLEKGHTRADFLEVAALCRAAGVTLVPTFVPFTPWTTLEGYVDLLDVIETLDLVEHVAPIQLAIRLLVTARSALLDLVDIRAAIQPFDRALLIFPWRHPDARVDQLQATIMARVSAHMPRERADTFAAISALARERAGLPSRQMRPRRAAAIPQVTEPWYCCAEPTPQQLGAI